MNLLEFVVKKLYPEYKGPIFMENRGGQNRTPVALKISAQYRLNPREVASKIKKALDDAGLPRRFEIQGPGFIVQHSLTTDEIKTYQS